MFWLSVNTFKISIHLEEVNISISVAQTEDVLLLWVLRDGLHDAALGKEGVARGGVLPFQALSEALVEQERAT